MFPMGAPMMYMPPHPDMAGHPPPEMGMDPHFRPPMMHMPYGMHPHPMGPPMMPPHQVQMNPNVPQFIPASQQQKRDPNFPPSSRTQTVNSDHQPSDRSALVSRSVTVASGGNSPTSKTGDASSSAAKPISRRLPIIDPTTGKEISIQPVSSITSSVPASALVTADVAFGDPKRTLSRTGTTESTGAPSRTVTTDSPAVAVTAPTTIAEESTGPARSKLAKLKNVALVKPKPTTDSVPATDISSAIGGLDTPPLTTGDDRRPVIKQLNRIRNIPLVKKQLTIDASSPTPPLVAPDAPMMGATSVMSKSKGFRLTNKTLSSSAASSGRGVVVHQPTLITPTIWPLTRDLFLKYLPTTRPDRNAPSSINVFPSELLGLRTAPHGDPGLSRSSSRRNTGGGGGGLQKTMSAVSSGSRAAGADTSNQWRSNKLGRTLSRQSSRGVKIGGIVRPSERGFKIVDQSSLSEKDKLRRQVMSLLNKLTVDSFGGITSQISEIEISQPWQMDVVIGLIFDKAVVEHKFSEMYAEMCRKLRTTWPELTGVDSETGAPVPVTFTRAIIEKCQVEFDAIPDTLEPTEIEITKAKGDPQDLEMFMLKKKERILGNMKFIAQLFLMRILSSRVVRSVVEQLLYRREEPEEHYIECVGILLHNIGATLYETDSGRAYITQFVQRLKDLCARENYGRRIKFLMKDVMDAAESGWSGKHAASHLVATAKSKEAVRRDAQTEEQKSSAAMPMTKRPSSSALSRQQAPPSNGGWVRSNNSGNYKPSGVLNRSSSTATALRRRESIPEDQPAVEDDEWEDEDEVSEYAPSSYSDDEEEDAAEDDDTRVDVVVGKEDDGFTRVDNTGRKRS